MSYVVAVDVGNSRIKLGLLDRAGGAGELPRCLRFEAIAHDADACRRMLAAFAGDAAGRPVAGIVAAVSPRGLELVLAGWQETAWDPPLVIDDPSRLPIEIFVDEPQRVGIDRVLNAVAVNAVRPPLRPAVIVDCGTAITVDAVTIEGRFAGGAILAGIDLAARALHQYTARLPQLEHEELATGAATAIGRNTRAAIRSGLVWGQLGAVQGLIERISMELMARPPESHPPDSEGSDSEITIAVPSLFLTGGGAPLLAPHLPQAQFEPHLVLQGLAIVALNSEPRSVPGTGAEHDAPAVD